MKLQLQVITSQNQTLVQLFGVNITVQMDSCSFITAGEQSGDEADPQTCSASLYYDD